MRRAMILTISLVSALAPLAAARAFSLKDALALAGANAPSLAAADASVARAGHAVEEARAALAPSLRLAANYDQNSEGPKAVFDIPGVPQRQVIKLGASNSLTAKTEALFTLSSGGRDPALVGAAEQSRVAQGFSRAQAGSDLTLRVSVAYYQELSADRLIAAAEEALRAARSHLSLAQARVRAGAAPRLDALQAQVEVSEREIAVVRAHESKRMARVELESAMGAPLPAGAELDPAPAPRREMPDSSAALQAALQRRPELAALDASIRESAQRAEAARAGKRPLIGLHASAQYTGPNKDGGYLEFSEPGLKTYGLAAGLSMSLPILDGGLTRARVAEQEAMGAEQEAKRRGVQSGVVKELAGAFSELRVARAVWQADSVRLTAAREGERLASEAYKGGSGTATDVRDAETALANAAAEEAEALADYWIANARLEHATGIVPNPTETNR